MIRPIIQDPTPPLRSRSREVDVAKITSHETQKIIRDLKDTLKVSDDGIGIAAPQISEGVRIFVISEEAKFVGKSSRDPEKKDWRMFTYINPVMTKKSRAKEKGIEGCLSVPGKFGVVSRFEKVSFEAYDETGKKNAFGATQFFARVLQHELDHLDGVLFIDKAERFVDVSDGGDERL
jgi:peptide deformylase